MGRTATTPESSKKARPGKKKTKSLGGRLLVAKYGGDSLGETKRQRGRGVIAEYSQGGLARRDRRHPNEK